MNCEVSFIRKFAHKIRGIKSSMFRRTVEVDRLVNLPRANCNVAGLGTFNAAWLAETFNQQLIDVEWAEDARRIAALYMPEMTGGVNPGDRRALYYLFGPPHQAG